MVRALRGGEGMIMIIVLVYINQEKNIFASNSTIFYKFLYASVKYGSVGANAQSTTVTCVIQYLLTKVDCSSYYLCTPMRKFYNL